MTKEQTDEQTNGVTANDSYLTQQLIGLHPISYNCVRKWTLKLGSQSTGPLTQGPGFSLVSNPTRVKGGISFICYALFFVMS